MLSPADKDNLTWITIGVVKFLEKEHAWIAKIVHIPKPRLLHSNIEFNFKNKSQIVGIIAPMFEQKNCIAWLFLRGIVLVKWHSH